MKIIKHIHPLTKEDTYDIRIEQLDDLEPLEIAECFSKQYPQKVAVIFFTKLTRMYVELLFVGFDFGKKEVKK